MAGSDATIKIEVTADTKDAQKGLEDAGKATSTFGDNFKSTFGGVLSADLVSKATDAIVDFGKASLDAAAQDAKAKALLDATLKTSGKLTDDQVKSTEDWIDAMSKTAAVADDDLRPALATLVRATGDTSSAQELLQIALDTSAGTGKDLQSVVDAMGKAALGSTGGLSKLGVATKDAAGNALSANDVFSNMYDTFKGQAAVAADSAAGKMANAKIQFGEFQEQVGGYLIPVVAKLADLFLNDLLPAIAGVVDFLSSHKDEVLAAVIGLGVVVGAVVIPAFVSWAIAAGAAAIATLAAAAPFIALGLVIAAVALVIIKNWDTISAAAKTAWDFVLGAIQFVWDWIKDNWPLLLGIITGPFGLAVAIIVKNWDTIMGAIQGVWNWLKSTWQTVSSAISAPFVAAWNAVYNGLIAPLTDAFNGVVAAIGRALSGVTNAITAPFSAAWNWISDHVLGPLKGGWNAIAGAINSVHFSVKVPDWVPAIGGKGFDFDPPNVPTLARGGLMTSDGLVFAHAGEVISPAPAATRPTRVGPAVVIQTANFAEGIDIEDFMRRAAWTVRTQGI